MTLLSLLNPRNESPKPQIDGIRYIERVSGYIGSNVMVLVFSVAVILQICKLDAFRSLPPPGKLGNFLKSVNGVF